MVRKRARLTDENDPLTPTDQVLEGLASFSSAKKKSDKSASQQSDKLTSQTVESDMSEKTPVILDDKLTSQKVDKLGSQEVRKLKLKKATFQLSESVLHDLDQLHLKLQLEQGKANAPYKEVIVEEAIANFLADFERNQKKKIDALTVRQNKR